MTGLLQVHAEDHSGIYVVHAVGEVDISTAPMLREQLDAAPEGSGRVVADLGGVTFLDSTGLGVLIAAHQHLTSESRRFELVISTPPVRKVLEVTSLLDVFTVHSTLEDALAL